MKLRFVGRKVTLKDSFIANVEKRMSKFDKYFDDDAEGVVKVTVESGRQTVELTVRNRGFMFRAERTDFTMESAFAQAADLIDRQVNTNKSKLGARIKKLEAVEVPVPTISEEVPVDEEYHVVRTKKFALKPMTVDEAILQMNMLGHSFFLFSDSETGITCAVYKRNDDDYGLIVPQD